jgi:hypothetical protein
VVYKTKRELATAKVFFFKWHGNNGLINILDQLELGTNDIYFFGMLALQTLTF